MRIFGPEQGRIRGLLMELRQEMLDWLAARDESRPLRVEPPPVPDFLLLGRPVGVVEGPTRRG